MVRLSVVLLLAAALLATGVLRLRRHGDPRLIAWPLGIFASVGVIGEIADLAGSASGTSNAIGAGLVVLAAIPVGLILWKP